MSLLLCYHVRSNICTRNNNLYGMGHLNSHSSLQNTSYFPKLEWCLINVQVYIDATGPLF